MRTGHKDRSASISGWGVVGSDMLEVREVPPPIHAITPPHPDRNRRGSPHSPSHRTLHAKYTFWNWKHGGVAPGFLPDKGGGGLFVKK
jgi:hypothetical protein